MKKMKTMTRKIIWALDREIKFQVVLTTNVRRMTQWVVMDEVK